MIAESSFLDREDVLGRIRKEFERRNPGYAAERKRLKGLVQPFAEELDRLQAAGHPMTCSEQILLEAQWLLNYTDDWARAQRRLSDLEASLAQVDQPGPHQATDGSWGGCCEEWYRKLEPTVDALQNLAGSPVAPLAFMKRLQDPARTLDYLWRLQITDVRATGRNDRDELGAVQSALSQLIFKDELRDLFADRKLGLRISPKLEESYLDYLWQTQHPRTGYWGPWYRFGDRLAMVQDLSFTFHVIQYRAGDIPNWPVVVDSTLAIKKLTYPAGWKPDSAEPYSNHNNYDVVTIFQFGWPHIDRRRKDLVRREIQAMLEWCLTSSVSGDGFKLDGESPIDSYYFGVRFLDRVGFWDPAKRFWSRALPSLPPNAPGPAEVCKRLTRGFETLKDTSEEAATVRAILKSAACLADGSVQTTDAG